MHRLYHYWSSVCSQKVRMCLAEKGLDWESRHVDIFAFENYEPAYTALNPKVVVPTLDHEGKVLIGSNTILEYLEDVFPTTRRSARRTRSRARPCGYGSTIPRSWRTGTSTSARTTCGTPSVWTSAAPTRNRWRRR